MTSRGEILARLFRAVVVLASLAGLVSAPAKVAYPSAFGASTYASSRPLNGSLATSNSPPRVTEPLPSSTRPAGRPVGPPVHHPVPNLDENPPPLAAAPSSLSVAPSGNRAEQLTTTAASWTAIGPMPIVDERCCGSTPGTNVGTASGRVTSLAVDPTNASVVYAGAAGGGVWKSINGGTTWTPLTDSQASLAIGALGISANGQVIYAGTGEDNGSDSQYGQGILVSTNGGSSWTLTGQGVFAGRHIGSIAVDRSNSSHALAATDVGLYTTNNTGTTWTQNTQILTQITAIGPATGGIFQVVQAPDNSLQFWATAGDRCQTEFGDILVSGDSGNTWSQSLDVYLASSGTAAASRIALDVGSGGTVYAALSDCNGKRLALLKLSSSVWARIDLGLGLDYFNLSGGQTGQGDYDNVVAVDPTSNNHVVFGGVTIVASSDGGNTYTDIGNVYGEAAAPGGFIHPDFHAIAFTGANSFYVGNDGGIWKTTDLGGSGQSSDWVNLNATLNTVQFFRGISPDLTHLLGGAQDNGSLGNLPGSASLPGWQGYHGGDGGFTAVNASGGATTVYAEYPHLVIERGSWTLNSSDQYSPYDSFQAAAPCISGSEPACGDPSGFTAPFRMDPTNPQRLIAGTNKVYQSTSGGAPGSWTATSPNASHLTRK